MRIVSSMRRLIFLLPCLLLSTSGFAQETETETTEPPATQPTDEEAGEPADDNSLEELQRRLAEQEEETALLREQLVESQRQSEELEEVNARLQDVDESVQNLQRFEQQRELLAQRKVEALSQAVVALETAGNQLFHGNADVLPELEFAGSTLEGEARQAALFAAELVRRGDLFNARSWVEQAQQQAQAALTASGARVADNPR